MNATDRLNAVKRANRTLQKDPNNIAALLEMAEIAGMLKKPDRKNKRIILNRVLALDPINKRARAMLLEMDRAEMGGVHVQRMTPILPGAGPQPPTSIRSQDDPLEQPQVFRYSLGLQLSVYLLIAFTVYIGWQVLQKGDGEVLLVIGAFLFALIIPLWYISAVVEVSNSGIMFSRLFGIARSESSWDELKEVRPNPHGPGMQIITGEGKVMEVSARISGYPAILETLRQKRPDLASRTRVSSPTHSGTAAGIKTFQKNSAAKYGPLFLVILGSLILVGTLVTAQSLVAIPMAVILFLLWRFTLDTPYRLKIERNRLRAESFLKKRELTASQIQEIKMVSTYSRWGIARSHIRIELFEGGSIWLEGFSGGDKMMYSVLRNWWAVNRNL